MLIVESWKIQISKSEIKIPCPCHPELGGDTVVINVLIINVLLGLSR